MTRRTALLLHRFLVAALLLAVLTSSARADADLDAANHAYTAGNYDAAAGQFQKIITQRGYSAALCFNLGNAEAQAGHPGLALLNYERARYLAPSDKDIDHNLQLERQKAGLKPNSFRWWQVMLRSIDWTVWLILIGACLVLIFLGTLGLAWLPGLAARTGLRAIVLRQWLRTVIFVAIPVALLLGYFELMTVGYDHRIEGVIVASKSATLWVSPFVSSDTRGTIPEGELVTVEDRHNGYYWIEARDKQFGWVRSADLAPVVTGSFDDQP